MYMTGCFFPTITGSFNCTALRICCCSCADVRSDRFRCPLHGFGGHLYASQKFQLLAAMIEGSLLANDGLHASHPRREFFVFDVEVTVDGELAGVAVPAQIVGT